MAIVILLASAKVRAGDLTAAPATKVANVAIRTAPKERDPIEKVGDDFESMMLQNLYNQMLQSNQIVAPGDDNPFAPSHGEMIYRSMQEQVMMQQLAVRRPLGVGALVARQLRGETGIGERAPLNSVPQER